MRTLITLIVFFMLVASCQAQTNAFALPEVDNTHRTGSAELVMMDEPQETRQGTFRRSLLKSLPGAVDAGVITQKQAGVIRLASFSPAFRNQAKMLGAIQMASSGVVLPVGDDGTVDVDAIPWETATLDQWIAFIRIILELLQEFGILK